MKNSRKAWLIFRRILFLLFIFYVITYFQAQNSNNLLSEKTILTSEKIKEFEEDVKNGEYIDIKNYTEDTYVDTSNVISNTGYNIGENITEFFGVKVVDFINFLSKFVS